MIKKKNSKSIDVKKKQGQLPLKKRVPKKATNKSFAIPRVDIFATPIIIRAYK